MQKEYVVIDNIFVNFNSIKLGYADTPEYYEWDEDLDIIENINDVVTIKVNEESFENLVLGKSCFSQELTNILSSNSYGRRRKKYLGIMSKDGQGVAVLQVRYGDSESLTITPINISKLDYRNHKKIIEVVEYFNIPVLELKWDKDSKKQNVTTSNISDFWDKKGEHIIGLTRREKILKHILRDALNKLSDSQNTKEMEYWYTELFPEMYKSPKLKTLKVNDMIYSIFEELKIGWTKKHEEFGNSLLKVFTSNKDRWDNLINLEGCTVKQELRKEN